MTKKSNEKLISEKIEWLRKQCVKMLEERSTRAALKDKPIETETEAFREAAKALMTVERYMIPEEETA